MFVIGNLFTALAQILNGALTIYTWIIIFRVLASWVNPDPFNSVVQFLHKATDPVLEPARRIIPPIGMIDISPIVVLLLLQGVQHFLVRTLLDMGMRMR
ncbi:MAG: YggT family protein [Candidatus Omnitrophica bacterium]|nr:YggT family protein [Candidatus Omnitrophota bacterium]